MLDRMTNQINTPVQKKGMMFAWAGALLALALESHHPISGEAALGALAAAVLLLAVVSRVKSRPISLAICALLGACFTSMSYFLTLHI